MEINYRLLNVNDLAAYRRVRLECLQMHPENFGSTYEEESASDSLLLDKLVAGKNPNDFLMGAFDEMDLIGICGFRQEGRRKTNHRGEIVQMYVRASFSGKGIGRHLLLTVLDRAFANPEIDQVTLGVVAVNEGAVGLYKDLGFVQFALLQNSFKHNGVGLPQIYMVLTRDKFNAIER